MVVMLIATIGTVLASAQTTEDDLSWGIPMMGRAPYCMTELTEEQHEELNELINEKLEEYGVELPTRDELLDKQIERTEQRLEILTRQKELRDEGYTWEEINEIIQEEYDLESPVDDGQGMMFQRGFRRGFRMDPHDSLSDEESDL